MIRLQQLLSNPVATLNITAMIETALGVGAGGSSGSLADKPIVRNAKGKLIIPGSQLKGRLRHECEKLARGLGWAVCESPIPQRMCPQRVGLVGSFQRDDYDLGDRDSQNQIRHHCIICQIFGNPALSSRLVVDDLVCVEEPENLPEVLRPGVSLSRSRRTAEDKKLYFLETSPANAQLQFEGAIYLQPHCHSTAQAFIIAGLKHIHALGGSKAAGLGWLQWSWSADFQINDAVWTAMLPEINV